MVVRHFHDKSHSVIFDNIKFPAFHSEKYFEVFFTTLNVLKNLSRLIHKAVSSSMYAPVSPDFWTGKGEDRGKKTGKTAVSSSGFGLKTDYFPN